MHDQASAIAPPDGLVQVPWTIGCIAGRSLRSRTRSDPEAEDVLAVAGGGQCEAAIRWDSTSLSGGRGEGMKRCDVPGDSEGAGPGWSCARSPPDFMLHNHRLLAWWWGASAGKARHGPRRAQRSTCQRAAVGRSLLLVLVLRQTSKCTSHSDGVLLLFIMPFFYEPNSNYQASSDVRRWRAVRSRMRAC